VQSDENGTKGTNCICTPQKPMVQLNILHTVLWFMVVGALLYPGFK